MYAMICTRRDVSFALTVTSRYSRYQGSLGEAHWKYSGQEHPQVSSQYYGCIPGAIAQAKELRSHQKTKHIVRRYHIIREIIDRGDVVICKVDTDNNIADPLTKPLGKLKPEGHTRSMGI
ncbi:unnamed protein product [Cuscuta campestris]|uniref:Uncharacterized protein n=1 Tax=Cuscuta campestris TaxID=132261 RepID=A0A484MBB6_9ASTE|nr:unnamed protein product [Cuscuta campestris]